MTESKPRPDAELKAIQAYKEAQEDVRTKQAAYAKAAVAFEARPHSSPTARANAQADVEAARDFLIEANAKLIRAALELARVVATAREATIERAVVLDDLLHAGGRCTCHGEGSCSYCKHMLRGEALSDALETAIKGLDGVECVCRGSISGEPCIHERVWAVSRAWEAIERHEALAVQSPSAKRRPDAIG